MPERVPLPLPIGWYCVAEEAELAAGEVRRVRSFGQELVVWRGADGAPHLFDAYCPHLGAHLGVGGKVEGGALVCPFHAWKYDGAGRCIDIPYARRIPPKAAVAAWPIQRANGLIFAWYDPSGGVPRFAVPEVPEWGATEWTAPEVRSFEVKTHPQEMAENIVDAVHFHFVHGTPHIPEMQAEVNGLEFHAYQGLTFTTPQGETLGRVDVTMFGPGFGITRFSGVVETLLMITGIPLEPGLHRTTIRFIVRKVAGNDEATRGVARAFVAEIARQYAQDIPIWEHKRYLERPLLCDGDGPILELRRYFRQFYPASEAR
jgi:phenylpropionate dioxygenase-like ring-hydroxylating dioxygenase large terminal subunit